MFFEKKNIEELRSKTVIQNIDLRSIREKARILVIDDEAQCKIHENLKRYGYKDVALERDVHRIEDVSKYNLILCDIRGIGAQLASEGKTLKYEGLTVAKEIKKVYPLIKVIAYSAEKKQYEGNYIAEMIVDDFFNKDDDTDDRNELIDKQIRSCFSPIDAWITFRELSLSRGTSIHEMAKLENLFVRSVLKEKEFSVKTIKKLFSDYSKYEPAIKHLTTIIKLIHGGEK